MEIWKEYEADVFNYFEYFNEKKMQYNEKIPKMSVFSINASEIYCKENLKEFLHTSGDEITSFYNRIILNNDYKVYLLVNLEIKNVNSKVENYFKVWKQLQKKWDINGFILGEEFEILVNNTMYFSSLAQIPISHISKAIEIVSSDPGKHTIFFSKSRDMMKAENCRKFIDILFGKDSQYDEINFFLFSLACCNVGDIAIRYGTSFEEAEIALVYNPEINNIQFDEFIK